MKMVLTTATLLSTSQHRFLGNRSTPTRVAETLTSNGKAEMHLRSRLLVLAPKR